MKIVKWLQLDHFKKYFGGFTSLNPQVLYGSSWSPSDIKLQYLNEIERKVHHHVIAGVAGRGYLLKQTPQSLWGPPCLTLISIQRERKPIARLLRTSKQACAAGVRLEVALLAADQIELQVVAFPSWAAAFPSWVVAFPSWVVAFPSWAAAFPSWVVAFPSWVVAFPSWVVAFPSWVVAFPFLAWVAFASLASPAFASPALIACQDLP